MRLWPLLVLSVTSGLEAAAITGGSVTITGGSTSANGVFALQGEGFAVTGRAFEGYSNALLCQGLCADDATVGTSAGLGEFGNGTAVLGGDELRTLSWWGSMGFRGPNIRLAGPGEYSAPFTMDGILCEYRGSTAIPPCVFFLPLTGQGVVYVTETRSPTAGGLVGRTAIYVFTPEAIPEASTGSLLAPGVAALAVRTWIGRRGAGQGRSGGMVKEV